MRAKAAAREAPAARARKGAPRARLPVWALPASRPLPCDAAGSLVRGGGWIAAMRDCGRLERVRVGGSEVDLALSTGAPETASRLLCSSPSGGGGGGVQRSAPSREAGGRAGRQGKASRGSASSSSRAWVSSAFSSESFPRCLRSAQRGFWQQAEISFRLAQKRSLWTELVSPLRRCAERTLSPSSGQSRTESTLSGSVRAEPTCLRAHPSRLTHGQWIGESGGAEHLGEEDSVQVKGVNRSQARHEGRGYRSECAIKYCHMCGWCYMTSTVMEVFRKRGQTPSSYSVGSILA